MLSHHLLSFTLFVLEVCIHMFSVMMDRNQVNPSYYNCINTRLKDLLALEVSVEIPMGFRSLKTYLSIFKVSLSYLLALFKNTGINRGINLTIHVRGKIWAYLLTFKVYISFLLTPK